jgi:hypothetical protein
VQGDGQARDLEAAARPSCGSRLATAVGLPVLSVLFCLIVAEIVLQCMPVASGLGSMPVDATHPVFHFAPNRPFVFSQGWDMHRVRYGRSNNEGWIDDQDYWRDDPMPLLAIIGDSYIEAQMVPYAETMQARLGRSLNGKFRVYAFAGSGAPLSQYLIWAGHAVKDYGARGVVINVVGNDFDESVCALKRSPGFWCYGEDGDGELRLRLIEHQPGIGTSLIRASALARYLLINLQVMQHVWRVQGLVDWLFGTAAQAQYAGNTAALADERRLRLSRAMLDAFFRDLPGRVGLPRERLLFTLDGFRTPADAASGRGSYFDLMRQAFLAKAQGLGYEVIDLDALFMAPGRAGQRYDYPDDAHWSGSGHAVAAEAVASSRMLAGLLQ